MEAIFSFLAGRTIAESKRKHEEKQLKAQQLREKLREEKSHKLQKLLERVSAPVWWEGGNALSGHDGLNTELVQCDWLEMLIGSGLF